MSGAVHAVSASLWDEQFFQLNKEEAVESISLREWLRSCPSQLGQYLADVTEKSPAGRFVRDDVLDLEKLIVRKGAKRTDAIVPLKIFFKVVYHLNREYQKSIPLPRYVFSMKREANPFVAENDLAHKMFQLCLAVEKGWIANLSPYLHAGIPDRKCNVPPELIVFSAALHGGILDIDVAMALFTALLEPEKYFHYSQSSCRVYADLLVAMDGMPDQEVRRWYPDDTLVCLISRTVKTSTARTARTESSELTASQIRKNTEQAIWNVIAAEFKRQSLESPSQKGQPPIDLEFMPKSMRDLFRKILVVLHSEIPSVLAEYAARKIDCQSLLPASIGRIYLDPAIDFGRAQEPDDSDDDPDIDKADAEVYGGNRSLEIEPPWLPDLRKVFRKSDCPLIATRLRKLLANDDPDLPRKRIFSFALRLADFGTTSGNKLHPSSVEICALTVARRIGRVIGTEDIAKYEKSALETLYLTVINDAAFDSEQPRGLQKKITWILREFHRFLVAECGAHTINEAEVFRFPRGRFPVDARIVSIEDISKALEYLENKASQEKNSKKQKHYWIAQAEIVFGFFAGLRRMESLGLRRVDYLGGKRAQVIVRATETRQLKTANATRQIPLEAMTHPFPEFLTYLDRVGLEPAKKSDPVLETALFDVASDNVIIPIIHEALQEVTGDRTIHYHTLRHSFCCWALLRCMLSDLPEIPDLFPHLEQTSKFLRSSVDFRQALYGGTSVTNDHLWGLSTLLGHSSPSVSLSNYVHIFDLLLPAFLKQSDVFGQSSDLEFRIASGFGKTRALELLPAESDAEEAAIPSNESQELREMAFPRELPILSKIAIYRFRRRFKDGAPVQIAPSSSRALPWLDALWILLSKYGRAGRSQYFPILNTGFEPEEAAEYLNRAAAISEFKATTGAYLHRMADQPIVGASDKSGRGCCPQRPRSRTVLYHAANLSSTLETMVDSNPARMKSFLQAYARNVLPDSCQVVFHRPFDQRTINTYIECLAAFGIREDALSYKLKDGTANREPVAGYLGSCGLPPGAHVENITDGRSDPSLPVGGLSIEPAKSGPGGVEVDTEAIRFVLLMASIAFG
jgi:integrase